MEDKKEILDELKVLYLNAKQNDYNLESAIDSWQKERQEIEKKIAKIVKENNLDDTCDIGPFREMKKTIKNFFDNVYIRES